MRNKEKQSHLRDVQDVIDIIGGRWRGAILASLCDKEKRFNELKRDLGSITPKTLTKELKYLELRLDNLQEHLLLHPVIQFNGQVQFPGQAEQVIYLLVMSR